MALPVNIEELIHGHTVEWERLEFKSGWNPEDVIHSMCAFANDLNNWGGGYIIVGISEDNGQPVLPPLGLQPNQLDAIQKKIVELGHKISPNYFPIVQPYAMQGRHILVIWCPAGDNRPYTAPTGLGKDGQRQPFVRIGSKSLIAQGENLRQLQGLTARIPFDDRRNNQASIEDLDLGLIQVYLQRVKSDLYAESLRLPFADLCRTMLIAKGPSEDIRPVNVGLLFFCRQPERFFNRAWIELVWHRDNSARNFEEIYFKGPIQQQLSDALSYLRTNIITEHVIKRSDRAEADRFYNYPYDAVEEVLANAAYHKSYELGSPIEIQVFPDKITILSYPGPVPPVNAQVLSTERHILAREYRNRRIGDFLKELHLTEGRGTGFPTIYDAMANNGSPTPVFQTDDRTYVLVTLPTHPGAAVSNGAGDQAREENTEYNKLNFKTLNDIIAFTNQFGDQASDQASDQAKTILDKEVHDRIKEVLSQTTNWIKRENLFENIGLSSHSKNRKKYLDPLIDIGWIAKEFPDTKTHPLQRYKLTDSGANLLKLLSKV